MMIEAIVKAYEWILHRVVFTVTTIHTLSGLYNLNTTFQSGVVSERFTYLLNINFTHQRRKKSSILPKPVC